MPKYIVEVWETRSYSVPVEADNEEDAKEIATDVLRGEVHPG